MKRQHILTIFLATFLLVVSFHGVSAAGPLDFNATRCGESDPNCTPANFFGTFKAGLNWIVVFATIFLIVLIPGYFIYGALKGVLSNFFGEADSGFLKEYKSRVTSLVVSFIILVGVLGFIYVIFSYFGLSKWLLKPLQPLLSLELIPHAYAQGAEYFSSPVEGTNDLYDFFLLIVRLVVRWFIYPGIIAIWIYTGFAYVAAQGNPEKLMKVHKWLFISVAATVITFLTESFVFAIRDTVKAITG